MYKLPSLPYPYNALEPYIDEQTMVLHHTKHHQAYVDNLNKALQSVEFEAPDNPEDILKNLDKIPEKIRQDVINNAGGHVNHTFFWNIMTPEKTQPKGKLLEIINEHFGSLEKFKEDFTNKAMTVFGSGWAFLIATKAKEIRLKRHSFQNSPVMYGNTPLLGIDLWEHAYYLKYQNRKLEYIQNWWNVVNWDKVEENYLKAIK